MQPGPSAVGRGRRRAAPPRRRRCWLDLPAGCWSSQVVYMCCAPIRYLLQTGSKSQIDFLTKNSCYENTVLFAQYATLIQIKLQ
jgi:hypothetical protein|eukprot:COSAG01_NODE_1226_length_11140_cov_73.834798_2_plen_84_part_00